MWQANSPFLYATLLTVPITCLHKVDNINNHLKSLFKREIQLRNNINTIFKLFKNVIKSVIWMIDYMSISYMYFE